MTGENTPYDLWAALKVVDGLLASAHPNVVSRIVRGRIVRKSIVRGDFVWGYLVRGYLVREWRNFSVADISA